MFRVNSCIIDFEQERKDGKTYKFFTTYPISINYVSDVLNSSLGYNSGLQNFV